MAQTVKLPAWKELKENYEKIKNLHLREIFELDPKRAEKMTIENEGIYFDYSKHRVNEETISLLLKLAKEAGLKEKTEAMFKGEKINNTEDRSVLHIALRAPKGSKIIVDGKDVMPGVHATLDKMAAFSEKVRKGEFEY